MILPDRPTCLFESGHEYTTWTPQFLSANAGSDGVAIMGKLQGKVAVITGATAGIGLAAADLFVKEGAQVFITGRRQKELDDAVRAIGHGVTGVQGDVANRADLDRLYETVQATGRRIDIVFANAG